MEVTRKGLVIIGVITTAIIACILFFTDMYISKLDEQARADMFNESLTTSDEDIFRTSPSALTKEQIDRLYELSNTTSTDPADIDLARRANAMLMRTMSTEEARKFGAEWEEKRLVSLQDIGNSDATQIENYVPEEPGAEEGVPEEDLEGYVLKDGVWVSKDSLTDEEIASLEGQSVSSNNKENIYKSLTDGKYYDSSLDDKEITLEELQSVYGFTEEELVTIPER